MPDRRYTLHACERLDECYYEARHESGLTVLVSPKSFTTYHAALRVNYGSTDRATFATGLVPQGTAHFLEHKMFGRADGSYDDDFAALGAEANAYTTEERTVYLFSCTDRFAEALEVLLRMVTDFSTDRRAVARERAIIAEELRMNADDPWERCFAALRRALYRRSPIREEICGTEASLRRITPRVLAEVHRAHYRPASMVLSVAGPCDPDEVLAVVDRVLGTVPADGPRPPIRKTIREPAAVHRPRVTVKAPTARPLFAIGIKASGDTRPEPAGLRYDLLLTLLTEMLFSHSGELYGELFESGAISPDLAYDVTLGQGYAYIALSGECRDPDEVYAAFRAYIDRMHSEGLSARELDRARRILWGDYVTTFDSPEDIAASLGGYAMDALAAGGRVGLYDFLPLAESLTLADAEALFADIFVEDRFSLVAVLPTDSPTEGDPFESEVHA